MVDDVPEWAREQETIPDWAQQPAQQVGTGEALKEGYLSGASMGWRDEIKAMSEASGLPEWMGGYRAVVGGPRLAYEAATGPGTATETYQKTLKEAREHQKAAQEQHPYAYGAGELGGTVGSMALLPTTPGVGLAARMRQGAELGAVTGAISGAGEAEGGTDRLTGAGTGALIGGIGGGLAAPVASLAESTGRVLYDKLGRPVVNSIRGAIAPAEEAERRLMPALAAPGAMQPWEFEAAQKAGAPMMLADVSEQTRQMARAAKNLSPEAANTLQEAVQERYNAQNIRTDDFIRRLVGNPQFAGRSRDELVEMGKQAYVPMYKKAYEEGDRAIWNSDLERLTSAPAVKAAMRRATGAWQNTAVADGFGAMNPSMVDRGGLLTYGKSIPVFPNLQFWDYTKRQLDDMIRNTLPGTNKYRDLTRLAGQLRESLGSEVPSYDRAKGTAAVFFGARDASDAGQKAASWRGNIYELSKILNKMNPVEKDLFREGYASALADRAYKLGDSVDVTKRLYANPDARQAAWRILGPQAATKLEVFMQRERLMDFARKAVMGGSNTMQQAIMMGLLGAGGEGIFGSGDPLHMLIGAAGGVGGKYIYKAGQQWANRRVAEQMANLLTQETPDLMYKALNTVSSNPVMRNMLRNFDTMISAYYASRPRPAVQGAIRDAAGNVYPGGVEATPQRQSGGKVVGRKQRFRELIQKYGA